jgi:CBS domain-containing protein
MLVKDVMSSPVITVDEDTTIDNAAQLMADSRVCCIVVTSKEEKPLGIMTERDFVARVLAKNIRPGKLTAKEVMTSPLITVDPDESLSEVARRMSQLNVRRLGVMYKGNLIGVISSKDILAITPELLEIIQEKARIEKETVMDERSESIPLAGYCEQCGGWSDELNEIEGNFLCEECRIEFES